MKVDFTEEFMSKPFYQGCDTVIDPKDFKSKCEEYDRIGGVYGEVKFDGIWSVIFWDNGGKARIFSRNQKEKSIPAFDRLMPDGTAIIGELAYGSQESLRRRALVGHDFIDAFGILYYDYKWMGEYSGLKQKEFLRHLVFTRTQSVYQDSDRILKEWIQISKTYYPACYDGPVAEGDEVGPLYEFLKLQKEGLVVKPINDQPYKCGTRSKLWMKFKKKKVVDVIVMGRNLSSAETKVAKGVPMAENIIVGQYVKVDPKRDLDKIFSSYFGLNYGQYWATFGGLYQARGVFGAIMKDGIEYILLPISHVGSMTHEWGMNFGTRIAEYIGQVFFVSCFEQFSSASLRHPSVGDDDGNCLRFDKDPSDCIFKGE